MTTARQRAAVHFCENWLYNISFESYCKHLFGNYNPLYIDNFIAVSGFLSLYLEDAKYEAESHIGDMDPMDYYD